MPLSAPLNKTQTTFSEGDLVCKLTRWLDTDGYRVRHEVSVLGQSADVVGMRGRWVTFFEAKVSDWRRALHQCQAHESIADYICIVIASSGINTRLKLEATRRGYGIVHYRQNDATLSWVCRPVRNTRVWRPQRKVWACSIRKIAYAD
jgi:hypothetical protein